MAPTDGAWEGERAPFDVVLADDALFVYQRIESDAEFDAVDRTLELLASFPYYGHVYDPLYEAARPAYEVRVTYAGRYGIYYAVYEALHTVLVMYIESGWRNPEDRFSGIQDFYRDKD